MRKKIIYLVAVVLGVVFGVVLAHKAPAQIVKTTGDKHGNVVVNAAEFKAATPPALTEVEKLKLENNELKITQLITAAQNQLKPLMEPLQADRQAQIAKLNAEHPGWQWVDATQQGQQSGFVKIPAPAKPANELERK